jgi:hypothetical protein
MKGMVLSLLKLGETVTEVLQLPSISNRGVGKKPVLLQPVTTIRSFQQRAKGILETFLQAIVANDEMDNSTVTKMLIVTLVETDYKAFDEVCLAISDCLKHQCKLDPHQQIAMIEDVNLSCAMMRKIHTHLIQSGCNTLTPEYVIRRLRQEFIRPTALYH